MDPPTVLDGKRRLHATTSPLDVIASTFRRPGPTSTPA